MSGSAGGQQPAPGNWRAYGRVVPKTIQAPPPPRGTFLFRDLNPGERIIWVRRQSYLFLIATAAPLVLLALGLALLGVWLGAVLPGIALLVGVGLLAALTLRWVMVDLWNWFFMVYVLTNQRIIRSRGAFTRDRGEIVLKSIAQVRVERPNVFYMILDVGNVVVRPIGPELELTGLANPRDVADTILAVQENPSFGLPAAPPAAPVPGVRSKNLQAALSDLAKPAPLPAVPVPRVRAPFMSFLHRKIPIKFIEGESVVEIVYRHWVVLLKDELIALVMLVAGLAVGVLLTLNRYGGELPLWLSGFTTIVAGIIGTVIYMNWADDVFLLTTARVIDIDRLVFFLSEYSNDAPYPRIQEVRVHRNFLGRWLGFGSIMVDTAGRRAPLRMDNIPGAYHLMDRIFEQIHMQRDRELAIAINKQKKENEKWMATLFNVAFIPVPDVRGRSVVAAAGELRKAGLRLIVEAERPARQAAGTVLDQTPAHGSTAVADGEVRVVLAGHPVAAALP
ncbi:MAG: PH domain-containing protein [Ktedonobacterales bacterium]